MIGKLDRYFFRKSMRGKFIRVLRWVELEGIPGGAFRLGNDELNGIGAGRLCLERSASGGCRNRRGEEGGNAVGQIGGAPERGIFQGVLGQGFRRDRGGAVAAGKGDFGQGKRMSVRDGDSFMHRQADILVVLPFKRKDHRSASLMGKVSLTPVGYGDRRLIAVRIGFDGEAFWKGVGFNAFAVPADGGGRVRRSFVCSGPETRFPMFHWWV